MCWQLPTFSDGTTSLCAVSSAPNNVVPILTGTTAAFTPDTLTTLAGYCGVPPANTNTYTCGPPPPACDVCASVNINCATARATCAAAAPCAPAAGLDTCVFDYCAMSIGGVGDESAPISLAAAYQCPPPPLSPSPSPPPPNPSPPPNPPGYVATSPPPPSPEAGGIASPSAPPQNDGCFPEGCFGGQNP